MYDAHVGKGANLNRDTPKHPGKGSLVIFAKLPRELFICLAGFLPFRDKALCATLICKDWCELLIKAPSLWRSIELPKFTSLLSRIPKGCVRRVEFGNKTDQRSSITRKEEEQPRRIAVNSDTRPMLFPKLTSNVQMKALKLLTLENFHVTNRNVGIVSPLVDWNVFRCLKFKNCSILIGPAVQVGENHGINVEWVQTRKR
ncbi:hypothetical protein HDU98_003698 [Podochytrium sp. JEL0797]|nr:hypothetical protein HDU98_003698 [Podochytrium sp. JEL0797]